MPFTSRHKPDGSWRLQVHIADVAHYVRTTTPLDNEARLRGTSVYFPDRAVPMLPEALSNGMCSLKPREDRLVMSALMEFDARGNMTGSRMTSGIIKSAERMTYTNVNKVLEGDAEATERYKSLAPHFRNMKELALLLNARRNEHGSIDFDLPERVIELDAQNHMINIVRGERNIAHRLIEEFMLAANRAVDGYLLKRGIASLHRVHEKPDAKKVLEFEDLARAFGYSLGVEGLHQREVAVRHGRTPAPAKAGRPDSYGHGRERGMRVSLPGVERRSAHHAATLSAPRPQTLRQTRRAHHFLPDASLSEASALRRRSARPLRARLRRIHAFHFADSPLSRPHRPSHFEMGARSSQRSRANAIRSPRQNPKPSSIPTRSSKKLPLNLPKPNAAPPEPSANSSTGKPRNSWSSISAKNTKASSSPSKNSAASSNSSKSSSKACCPSTPLKNSPAPARLYREKDHAIVATSSGGGDNRRPGKGRGQQRSSKPQARPGQQIWQHGDKVRVRAERIDPIRRRVEFALV